MAVYFQTGPGWLQCDWGKLVTVISLYSLIGHGLESRVFLDTPSHKGRWAREDEDMGRSDLAPRILALENNGAQLEKKDTKEVELWDITFLFLSLYFCSSSFF